MVLCGPQDREETLLDGRRLRPDDLSLTYFAGLLASLYVSVG